MNAIKSLNGSTIVFNKMPRIECEDITVKVGEHIDLFNHLVAYDEDNIPVGIDDVIISKSNVDTSKAGNYQIVVEVNDRTNTFRVQHTVNVIVKTNDKPNIIGASDIEIPINEVFDPMYGVIATDTEDGVISDKIKIDGFLNVCKIGLYTLTYSVTDSDNNTTTVNREVKVIEKVIKENVDNNIENDKPKEKAEDEKSITQENIEIYKAREEEDINTSNDIVIEDIENIDKLIDNSKVNKKKKKKVKKKRKKEKPQKLSRRDKKLKKKEEKARAKQEKKDLKEEYKKVNKNTFDLLPFLEIAEDNTFKTKNGYIDIFQIGTKDLNSLNNDDAHRHIRDFTNFLRNYVDDMKIISMTFPVNTQVQQEHILKNIEMTDNIIYRNFLNKRLDQLIAIEEKRKNKEFYLMVFYEDEKIKRERELQLLRLTSSAIKLSSLDLDKKLKIIFKLNNQNSKI